MTAQNLESVTPVIEQKSQILVEKAIAMKVTSMADKEIAVSHLRVLKLGQSRIGEIIGPFVATAYEAWKKNKARENELLKPLQDAEKILKGKVLQFDEIEEERIRVENRRLQKEAEEKARVEAERLKAEKEAQKVEVAESLTQQGFVEEAKEVMQQQTQVSVAPVFYKTEAPKVEGASTRGKWKGEVTDIKLLLAEILAGRQPTTLIKIEQRELDALAKSWKDELTVPGVRVYCEKTLAIR
jgi:hypothetical protein